MSDAPLESPYVRVRLKPVKGWDESKRGGAPTGTFGFRDSEDKRILLKHKGALGSSSAVFEANMTRGQYNRWEHKLDIVSESKTGANAVNDITKVFIPGNFPHRDLLLGSGVTTLGQLPSGKGSLEAITEAVTGLTKEQGMVILKSGAKLRKVAADVQTGALSAQALNEIEFPSPASEDPDESKEDPDDDE